MTNSIAPLLKELSTEIAAAVTHDTSIEQYNARFPNICALFDDASAFKLDKGKSIPGVNMLDIKRSVKDIKNTYHSVFSAIVDEEIKIGKARKELGIVAKKLMTMHDSVQAAVDTANHVAVETIANATNTLKDDAPKKVKKVNLVEEQQPVTGATIGDAVVDKAKAGLMKLGDSAKDLAQAMRDAESTDKAVADAARQLDSVRMAPTTPDGWKEEQKRSAPNVEEENKRQNQDEIQFNVLSHYQPAIQKLLSVRPGAGSNWVVAKGPVFFSSNPYVKEMYIKAARIKGSQFYPGWILEDQYLLGITRDMISKKNDLFDLVNDVKEALQDRLPSRPVFMLTPKGSEKTYLAPEKGGVPNSPDNKNKKKDLMSYQVPRFVSLKGSNLLWTWFVLKDKYKHLPTIKVENFGFPVASDLRGLDERLSGKITPNLHEDLQEHTRTTNKLAEIRQQITVRHEIESKELRKELQEIVDSNTKLKAEIKSMGIELTEKTRERLSYEQALKQAANAKARGHAKDLLAEVDSQLNILKGKISGLALVSKTLRTKESAIKERINGMLHQARMDFSKAMKGEWTGK